MYSIASLSLFLLRNRSLSDKFLSMFLDTGAMIEVFFVVAGISVRVILFYRISIP